jgi:hypothetical protein
MGRDGLRSSHVSTDAKWRREEYDGGRSPDHVLSDQPHVRIISVMLTAAVVSSWMLMVWLCLYAWPRAINALPNARLQKTLWLRIALAGSLMVVSALVHTILGVLLVNDLSNTVAEQSIIGFPLAVLAFAHFGPSRIDTIEPRRMSPSDVRRWRARIGGIALGLLVVLLVWFWRPAGMICSYRAMMLKTKCTCQGFESPSYSRRGRFADSPNVTYCYGRILERHEVP